MLDNNLPIDVDYYLHNQLSKPLQRIFEPIIENTDTLLSGDHTRTICKPTPTAKKGGIMMCVRAKRRARARGRAKRGGEGGHAEWSPSGGSEPASPLTPPPPPPASSQVRCQNRPVLGL